MQQKVQYSKLFAAFLFIILNIMTKSLLYCTFHKYKNYTYILFT